MMQNKFYKLIIFLCVLILTACAPKSKKLIQEVYAEALVEQYVSDMEKKYHLHHTSMLWQMYGGIVNLLGPTFWNL